MLSPAVVAAARVVAIPLAQLAVRVPDTTHRPSVACIIINLVRRSATNKLVTALNDYGRDKRGSGDICTV